MDTTGLDIWSGMVYALFDDGNRSVAGMAAKWLGRSKAPAWAVRNSARAQCRLVRHFFWTAKSRVRFCGDPFPLVGNCLYDKIILEPLPIGGSAHGPLPRMVNIRRLSESGNLSIRLLNDQFGRSGNERERLDVPWTPQVRVETRFSRTESKS